MGVEVEVAAEVVAEDVDEPEAVVGVAGVVAVTRSYDNEVEETSERLHVTCIRWKYNSIPASLAS